MTGTKASRVTPRRKTPVQIVELVNETIQIPFIANLITSKTIENESVFRTTLYKLFKNICSERAGALVASEDWEEVQHGLGERIQGMRAVEEEIMLTAIKVCNERLSKFAPPYHGPHATDPVLIPFHLRDRLEDRIAPRTR